MTKIKLGRNQDGIKSYVTEDKKESLKNCLNEEAFIKFCIENINTISDSLMVGFISNLVPLGEHGREYIKEAFKDISDDKLGRIIEEFDKQLNEESQHIPLSYESLSQLGYQGERKQGYPISNALERRQRIMMENRGLYVSEKGKITMNANTFSQYLLKRLQLIHFVNNSIFIYNRKGYYDEITEALLKKVCRDILHEAKPNIWNRKWENEYFEALKREMHYVDALNSHHELINLKNGMFNLNTMQLMPHNPKYYSTIQNPIKYNKGAACPRFIEFLLDIFQGDKERVLLVQELMGICFTRESRIHKAFIFYGPGSNGKSLLAEIIRILIGVDNTSNVSLNDLSGRFGFQNLPNKLVNISTENEFSKKFNTQNFKMLTSGDAVEIEKKFKTSYSTVLHATLIILVNKMMDSNDYSDGYYRRLQIIPFDNTYIEKKVGEVKKEGVRYMDKNLKEKLLEELDGILNFALEGLQRLIKNDFNLTYSQLCEDALNDYKSRQNLVIRFFKDRINVNPDATTKRPDFKKAFTKWAVDNGFEEEANMGATKFWDLMNKILSDQQVTLREKKINGDIFIDGLEILYNKDNAGNDRLSEYVQNII